MIITPDLIEEIYVDSIHHFVNDFRANKELKMFFGKGIEEWDYEVADCLAIEEILDHRAGYYTVEFCPKRDTIRIREYEFEEGFIEDMVEQLDNDDLSILTDKVVDEVFFRLGINQGD